MWFVREVGFELRDASIIVWLFALDDKGEMLRCTYMLDRVEDSDVDRVALKGLAALPLRCFGRPLGNTPLGLPKDDLLKGPAVLDKALDQRTHNVLLLRPSLQPSSNLVFDAPRSIGDCRDIALNK